MTDYLEPEELNELLHIIDRARDRLLVQMLYESGCSISELSTLKTSHVKADGTTAFADRTAIISPALTQALLKQANEYIFSSRQTETITPKRIQQILKPYLARVHKGKITPHVLRYTHIIHAYRQGLTIQAICKQTGLTPVRVAQIVTDAENSAQTKGYGFHSEAGGSA